MPDQIENTCSIIPNSFFFAERGVLLEDRLVGLDGNGDWGDVEGSLKLVWGAWSNILVALDGTGSLGSIIFAGSSSGGVWVSGLGLNSVLLDVSEGVVHKTTIAAHVSVDASSAVNELLLGVGVESTSGKELSTLDGTSGGESPA